MATGIHHAEVNLPISVIWDFVSDFEHWAPLLPGYVEHRKIDAKQSIWKIQGEIGKVRKTVPLKVELMEVLPPTRIAFSITAMNNYCHGNGYFIAKSITNNKTKITGFLEISAKGMMGPMVNPVLRSKVPKLGRMFTERVAREITLRQPQFA